jgi:hypothetical protein
LPELAPILRCVVEVPLAKRLELTALADGVPRVELLQKVR